LNIHEQYEELCALAASGQASPVELADLKVHLDECPECRALALDFTQVSAQALSQLAAKRLNCRVPTGMTRRFVARARSEGIAMTREDVPVTFPRRRYMRLVATGALAAAILVGATLVDRRHQISESVSQSALSIDHAQPASMAPTAAVAQPGRVVESESDQQQASRQRELNSLRATVQQQENEIRTADANRDALTSRLGVAEQQAAHLESEKEQLASRLVELQSEVEAAKANSRANDVTVELQKNEIRDLQNKLADRETVLAQQEDLLGRGSDVRDLIVARNLHIIDVHDRDGNGKSQRVFGRIFYTEGKSLIFYAYDLADPRTVDAKVTFHVWGERLGAEKPIQNLGVFHSDDVNDGRWVLNFDDSNVLAQINSVFVTVESARKSVKEPGGKRILFAFLGDKPNHP
jgi:hypothetical protein